MEKISITLTAVLAMMLFIGGATFAQEADESGDPSIPPTPAGSGATGNATIVDENRSLPQQAKGAPDLHPGRGGDRSSGGTDSYGHSWVDGDATYGPSYNWIELNTTGTAITGASDDGTYGPFALGFTFNFYGTDHTEVYVNSNGWISFTTSASGYYSNYGLPTASAPGNMIAPFWDDLAPHNGGTIWYRADTSPYRFIVEWEAVPKLSGGALETFQVIINANGSIQYQYKTVSDVTSVTVGMQNSTGGDGLEVVYNSTYLKDSLAILLAKRFRAKDSYGYFGTDSNHENGPAYAWVEINGIGTALSLGDDSNSGPIDLGFTFNYYGTDFTSVRVCANGWLSFTSTSGSYTNTVLPSSGDPNNLLALLWDDLQPVDGGGGGLIYYYQDPSADRFIVEYDGVEDYSSAYPQYAQVILKGDDSIQFQYKDVGAPLHECTVGIENSAGTVGLEAAYDEYYLHNDLALRFTPPGRLTTNFATNNGSSGNTFDLIPKWSIEEITGIDINTSSTSTVSVDVYYKSGTCVGYEGDSGAWTLLASGTATGQGSNNPTYIALPGAAGVGFGGGLTYGFFVYVSSGGISYTNGGPTTYENTDLKLISNSGQGGLFSSYFYPREWNGTIHYTLDPDLIELVSFEAKGYGQSVLVSWETASEIDTAGFHIWRSWKRNPGENDYLRVTGQLIPAEGNPSWGATYTFVDRSVVSGHAYAYRLEDIGYDGESTFHEPAVVRWWKPAYEDR